MPQRIQRKRTKGWKMPPNTLCATRPGKFGNPFKVGVYVKLGRGEGKGGFSFLVCWEEKHAGLGYVFIDSPQTAVNVFREYRLRYPFHADEIAAIQQADFIACFCRLDQPCHTDVLLEIASAVPAISRVIEGR